MGWFSDLFKRAKGQQQTEKSADAGKKTQQQSEQPQETRPDGPYLTQKVVFGAHLYRTQGEDSLVYFVDEKRGIRKMLVNADGQIQNFPGIVKEDIWIKEVAPNAMRPQIRFRTSFEERFGRWIMLWEIQPDGRYWEDEDGFGAEKDKEVTLYTYVDRNGNFTGPFRIFKVGTQSFTPDRFESHQMYCYQKALDEIKNGKNEGDWIYFVFPQFRTVSWPPFARRAAIRDRAEAQAYWGNPVLSRHLLEVSEALLDADRPVSQIMDEECCQRVQACMTLFHLVSGEPVFQRVLDRFFDGKPDETTVEKFQEL